MKIRMAMLADFAMNHPDGKLYILGGGVEAIRPPAYPYVHPTVSLVAKVEFTPAECGRLHTIEVVSIDADGRPFGPPAALQLSPERNPEFPQLPVSAQFVINVQGLQFLTAGTRAFSILVDGVELESVALHLLPSKG